MFTNKLTETDVDATLEKFENELEEKTDDAEKCFLNLSNYPLSSTHFKSLENILTTNRNLKVLILANTQLENNTFIKLLQAAKKNPHSKLTSLYVDRNNLTAECIYALKDFLQFNITLTKISFKKNKLGNVGIIKIGNIIRDLRKQAGSDRMALETLLINDNGYNEVCQSAINEMQDLDITLFSTPSSPSASQITARSLNRTFNFSSTPTSANASTVTSDTSSQKSSPSNKEVIKIEDNTATGCSRIFCCMR